MQIREAMEKHFFIFNAWRKFFFDQIRIVPMHPFFQMHVPNYADVYGSQYLEKKVDQPQSSYRRRIIISKSYLKALDQPSERCTKDTKSPNVSGCIAKFIEGHLGCSAGIQGSGSPQKITCNNVTQLLTWQTLANELQEGDANQIYDITGCLGSCEKYEYHIELERKNEVVGSKTEYPLTLPNDTQIYFRIMKGSHIELEQYLLYDFDSFIADIGGFMGLLLGFSVLSIYNETMDFLVNKCKVGWIRGKSKQEETKKQKQAQSVPITAW